jgi:hypothetical protein
MTKKVPKTDFHTIWLAPLLISKCKGSAKRTWPTSDGLDSDPKGLIGPHVSALANWRMQNQSRITRPRHDAPSTSVSNARRLNRCTKGSNFLIKFIARAAKALRRGCCEDRGIRLRGLAWPLQDQEVRWTHWNNR